jgi:hypothetical protein
MKRPVIESKIAQTVKKFPKGSILFISDFLDYGNSENIKKAFFRLAEKQIIIRLAHGIYLFPKIDKALGTLYPSVEEIAKAIAKRDKARIMPTGIQAQNKLGLSTQLPMKVVFLTDGIPRSIKIGKQTITFKKASPKNLMATGEISGLVIQVLKSIGQNNIKDEMILKLKPLLKKEMKKNILHDAKLAPAWINKILLSTAN